MRITLKAGNEDLNIYGKNEKRKEVCIQVFTGSAILHLNFSDDEVASLIRELSIAVDGDAGLAP